MRFENGYKVMYEAPKRVTPEKPGKFYASKTIPNANDTMLVSYNNGNEYVDLRTFKLIYSDGQHLLGSVSGKPSANDINIVLKCGNEIVFGKVIDVAIEEPAPVQTVAKRSTRKTAQVVEEEKVEE